VEELPDSLEEAEDFEVEDIIEGLAVEEDDRL